MLKESSTTTPRKEYRSMYSQSTILSLSTGAHTVELKCKSTNNRRFFVDSSNAIITLFTNKNNNTLTKGEITATTNQMGTTYEKYHSSLSDYVLMQSSNETVITDYVKTIVVQEDVSFTFSDTTTLYSTIELEGTNYSSLLRSGENGDSGSGANFHLIPNVANLTEAIQFNVYAKSTSGNGAISNTVSGYEIITGEDEIGSVDLSGATTSSTSWVDLKSITLNNTNFVGESLIAKVGIVATNTISDDLAEFRIKTQSEEGTITYRNLNTNEYGIAINMAKFVNVNSGEYIVTLQALTEDGTITLNGGTMISYFAYTTTGTENIYDVSAYDINTLETLQNLTATSNGLTLSTTTGVLSFPSGVTANITLNATDNGGYFSRTFSEHNSTLDLNASLFQTEINFFATEIITGNNLTNVSFYYDNGTEIETHPTIGTINVTAKKTGYYDLTQEFIFLALDNKTVSFEGMYDLLVNVTVKDYISGTNIQNWSGTINNAAESYSSYYEATGGQQYLYLLQNYEYVTFVNSSDEIGIGLAQYINFTSNSSTYDLTYLTYEKNSMIFNVYNLTSGNLITANVDLTLTGDSITYSESFIGGVLNKTNIIPGTYTIKTESNGFSTSYLIASVNGTYQLINVYLDDSTTSSRTFYVVDNANDNVQGATVGLTLNINGTVITILQKETDLSGSSTFDLDITKQYGVVVSKTGYLTYTGLITPVQEEYTINIQQEGSEIFQSINEDFALSTRLIYTPGDSYAYVKYQTTSPTGSIIYFGTEAIFNNLNYSQNLSGTPGGGTILLPVLINTSIAQLMNITYYYMLTDGTYNSWEETFFVNVVSNEDNTLITNAFDPAGMGNGTKIFIGMLIITTFLLLGFMFSRDMTVSAILGLVGVGIVWFKEFLPGIYCGLISVAVVILIIVDNMGGR
jgi:hypothetical protein